MNNWNEIRTAYMVGKFGTVSAAAKNLGVHRATVIRHIDALESVLGQKVFLRHNQGYTPTEAGRDLIRVADGIDHQFSDLLGRNNGKNAQLSGELVVTSMEILNKQLMPVMQKFLSLHPGITLRYEISKRVFALEYGEAHIALRMGRKPSDPDNVVLPFINYNVGLYASREYVEEFGCPKSLQDFENHRFLFISRDSVKATFEAWFIKRVKPENIVFKACDPAELHLALENGIGIGFYPVDKALENDQIVEVYPRNSHWTVPTWLVTHADQHRTQKVQAFLTLLKAEREKYNQQMMG